MLDAHCFGVSEFVRQIPDGANRGRLVCPSCGPVACENPDIVVGSGVALARRALLCRRTISALLLALGLCYGARAATVPPAAPLPVPPPLPPQWQAMQDSSPAPVPNPNVPGPSASPTAETPLSNMTLRMAPQKEHRPGDGFINGSAGQYEPERRSNSSASPGVRIRVPLQQQ